MSRDASGRSPTPAASETIAVEIETVAPSGDGLAHHRGTRIFVPFSIPGERVRVRVKRTRGRDAWATIETILTPSPHRVTPQCRHFGAPDVCGGCTWQHIAYSEQLRLKSDLVGRLVSAAIPRLALDVRSTLPGTPPDHPWGYRHKVHFVFADGKNRGPIVMGHYARGSRRVFPARECPVHDSRGNAFAFAFREACTRAGVAGPPRGAIRHLAARVAAATGEMMATLVVAHTGDKRLRDATKRALDTRDAPQSFHLNLHDSPDPYIFGVETRHVRGPRHLRERVAETTFLISPTAFFQTNAYAAEILVRLVLDALPAGQPVLDLYAGVGLFALPLAVRGDRVLAVEENQAAVDDGVASLKLNGVPPDRCRFDARRVEAALRRLPAASARHVVLDPPRDGCAPAVLDDVFGRLRPDRAVYVSCNPEALAIDLARIVGHGYRVEGLQPVDMFPHTAHIETVAVLRQAAGTERLRVR